MYNSPQVTFNFALPLQRNCCAAQSALSQLVGQAAYLQATVTLQRGAWVPPPLVLSTGAPVYIHTGVASTTSLSVDVKDCQPVSFGSVSAQSSLNVALNNMISATFHTKSVCAQRPDTWGPSPFPLAAPGAVLRAAFPQRLSRPAVTQQWQRMAHTLGGLLSVPLSLLASCSRSIAFQAPSLNEHPEEQALEAPAAYGRCHAGDHGQAAAWVHGALPAEPVCTENLAALLRLLPCGMACGLASLLNGSVSRLAGVPFLAMRVRLAPGSAHLSVSAILPGQVSQQQVSSILSFCLPTAASSGCPW